MVLATYEVGQVGTSDEPGADRRQNPLSAWLADAGGWIALLAPLPALALVLLQPEWRAFSAPAEVWLFPVVIAAAWCARRASRQFEMPRTRKLAWKLLSMAVVLAAVAAGATLALEDLRQPAAAGITTGLRLGIYPLLGIASWAFCWSPPSRDRWLRTGLDLAVVAVAAGAALWLLAERSLLGAALDGAAPWTVAAVCALLDAGLLFLALLAATAEERSGRASAGIWLAAAAAVLLAADLLQLYETLLAPDWIVALSGLSLALVAIAAQVDLIAVSRTDGRPKDRTGTSDLGVLPVGGLLLSMGLLLRDQIDALHEPPAAMAVAVCLAGTLLLLRQRMATQDVASEGARQAHAKAEARFGSLLRNSADVIAIASRDAKLFYVTPSVERVFGQRADEMLGQGFVDLFAPEDRGKVREFFVQQMTTPGSSAEVELRVPRGGNHYRVVQIVGTNLTDERNVGGYVLNIRDITDRKRLQDQLIRLAFHDPLTLLANRALFRDRVEHAITGSRRRGNEVAAIFVDLDDFKKINDSLGHGEGDRVLRATAQRLSKCTRASDTVARLGGDEFAILVEDSATEHSVTQLASRIVDALQEPFAFGGSSLRVAASVGVAFAGDGDGVEELLRNADVAMYHAKAGGKGRYSVFQPKMQEAVRERLRIEADLGKAIGKNELRLHYQPIVDLESGYLLGVEALVRWQHPTRGLIPPAEFIKVAEESGQVIGLGRWVLYEACSQVRAWQRRMPMGELLRVAINVSGRQLQGDDLVAEVRGALEHSGLDAGCLVVEMTESVVMQDTEATFSKLKALKQLGVRIAIDDFGTGYSSLSYLHRFPIDILKIDRSFVERLGAEKDGAELARAIITLGETLGLEVVAEGIELEHQVRQLMELGCVAGQGFYYSKPALLSEIEFSHQAKLRKAFIRELSSEATVSATGRFRRPTFTGLTAETELTGTFGP